MARPKEAANTKRALRIDVLYLAGPELDTALRALLRGMNP
jgi:hypothetical protein